MDFCVFMRVDKVEFCESECETKWNLVFFVSLSVRQSEILCLCESECETKWNFFRFFLFFGDFCTYNYNI